MLTSHASANTPHGHGDAVFDTTIAGFEKQNYVVYKAGALHSCHCHDLHTLTIDQGMGTTGLGMGMGMGLGLGMGMGLGMGVDIKFADMRSCDMRYEEERKAS